MEELFVILGFFASISLVTGLQGKIKVFLIIFGVFCVAPAALTFYDYQVNVVPGFGNGEGDDGSRIGSQFALGFIQAQFVVMLAPFCIGFAVRKVARWMKKL